MADLPKDTSDKKPPLSSDVSLEINDVSVIKKKSYFQTISGRSTFKSLIVILVIMALVIVFGMVHFINILSGKKPLTANVESQSTKPPEQLMNFQSGVSATAAYANKVNTQENEKSAQQQKQNNSYAVGYVASDKPQELLNSTPVAPSSIAAPIETKKPLMTDAKDFNSTKKPSVPVISYAAPSDAKSQEMGGLIQSWKMVSIKIITPKDEGKDKKEGKDGGNDSGSSTSDLSNTRSSTTNTSSTSTTTDTVSKKPVDKINIYGAGQILMATLDTIINSDQPGPVWATIQGGIFNQDVILGAFKMQGDALVLTFNKISLSDHSIETINAIAINPSDDNKIALASSVQHHYLERFGALLGGAFLQGYGQAVMTSGTTQSMPIAGTTGTADLYNQIGVRTMGQNAIAALGQVGTTLGGLGTTLAGNVKTTVILARNTSLGLLLLDPVSVPATLINPAMSHNISPSMVLQNVIPSTISP